MNKGVVSQADIQEMDDELQAMNIYGPEDSEAARMCLALISVGVKKRTVEMLTSPSNPHFKEYWSNLEKGGYFDNGKRKAVTIENYENVTFVLMMKVAQGKLQRSFEAKKSGKE